jgi:segregation and condensation protein B
MSITDQQLKLILEAAIMASSEPLSIEKMLDLFVEEKEPPARDAIKDALGLIETECEARGVELKKVSSGYRFQARKDFAPWVSRLWEEKPARYSRALLETLVLIAYKQPITRGEIEHVRGVAVSTNIIKTLLEREWVRVVGHRDVPGKPALYATTKSFLDYFNLTSLEELPTLAEIRDLDKINPELDLQQPEAEEQSPGESVSAEELQQQVAEALDSDSQAGIEQEGEITGEQAATTEDLEAEIEEEIDSNQDDRDDVMLDEHDKEIESRLIAEEEELIAATEAVVDDEIVAESDVVTDEVPPEDLSITDQPESSMDDDIVDEAAPDEEQALETTTVDSDDYSDSDELGSKFGS